MDPNSALQAIRAIIKQEDITPADAQELAILVEGLDSWITGGGYLPTAWAEV